MANPSDTTNAGPRSSRADDSGSPPSKPASYSGYESWKRWDAVAFGTFSTQDAAYFRSELDHAGVTVAPGLRVVELGFGNGGFAGWACGQGFSYLGTEVNPELILRARRQGFEALSIDQPLGECLRAASVDICVAWDVLEHLTVTEIEALLAEIRDILKPHGTLLARVPSGDSPFGRAVFHGDLTHRTALGSSAVRQLAARQGFEVILIAAPRFPWGGLGVRRGIRRLMVLAARWLITRLINAVFHDNAPRVINQTMVFVLRKPAEG